MKEVVIVSACRTAIGTFGGALKDMNGPMIASVVMKEAIRRAGIEPGIIDDVRFGCCFDHPDSINVSRIAALLAGLPDSIPSVTVNRVCISGMESGFIRCGYDSSRHVRRRTGRRYRTYVRCPLYGSQCPLGLPFAGFGICRCTHLADIQCGSRIVPFSEDAPVDTRKAPASDFVGKPYIMGHTAEFVAQRFNIGREEMDEVALRSHNNAERATRDGLFNEEIVPVEVPQRKKAPVLFDKDEHFRPGITMEQLQALPPAFIPKTGKVTAGNSSGLNDGGSAMVIMSGEKARELNLQPIARIRAVGKGACHPALMGISPVPAVKDLMKRNGLAIGDFELVEVNEAFAAQYIGCERELGLNREITNVNGSGIGLGHPVGSTGARIMVTLLHAMKNRKKGWALRHFVVAAEFLWHALWRCSSREDIHHV